ncbi:MAG TPA: helix-turn-helix domain-containing protein [Microthrixaceae bacterium]|nr:helix-turn-helix domain-containing protein [Microthrixaceae bacterium]
MPHADDHRRSDDRTTIDLRADSDTRDRLVQAAADVFREKGYTGTRVQEIARRAGFTSGALYAHFDSRAELLAEAIAVENSRMFELVSDALGRSIVVGSGAIASSIADFVRAESAPTDQLMLDGFAICTREPEAQERIGESLNHLLDQLEGEVGRMAVRPDSLMADDPGGMAYLMVSFMCGVAALRAAGLSDRAPERIEAALAEFLHGLGAIDDPAATAAADDRPG